ncbi:hypothetical protein M8C21_026690 [Ambrosia artemisiifolia]|uniref:Uncharacterized protein n=1 Tax=Ambrosia artemisiifolia TaxID=4212 RepID=A0AAD5D7Y0_AMBAR|nr:hypothetical protein M8C21_026690 [Ambrosia artemisiifolia]
MASLPVLTILDQPEVSPLPATVTATSLPLTFIDMFYLRGPPIHFLFFYDLPLSTVHFTETTFSLTRSAILISKIIGYHLRDCDKFYHLIPLLGNCSKTSDYVKIPIFSLQVTLFPNYGISIGKSIHHSVVDATTQFSFLKAWTSIARFGTDDLKLSTNTTNFQDFRVQPIRSELHLS